MKNSIIISLSKGEIKIDPTAKNIWRNIELSLFFAQAISKFRHYTHPTGYRKGEFVFILNHIPFVEQFLKSEEQEMQVELIEIDEADVPHFLIAFLAKEHKQPATVAELIRLFLNYTKSGAGKNWYDNYPDSKDKEEIISKVFGINVPSVKAYLHLIRPGREKYLSKLTNLRKYSLHEVYQESRESERKDKAAPETPAPTHPTQNSGKSVRVATSGITPVSEVAGKSPSVPSPMPIGEAPIIKVEEPAVDESAFDKEVLRHEAQYKADSGENFVQRIIAYLTDGSLLQLTGKIALKAKEVPIKTTHNFEKCSDGTWFMPSLFGPVSIEISLDDPIQSPALSCEITPAH